MELLTIGDYDLCGVFILLLDGCGPGCFDTIPCLPVLLRDGDEAFSRAVPLLPDRNGLGAIALDDSDDDALIALNH